MHRVTGSSNKSKLIGHLNKWGMLSSDSSIEIKKLKIPKNLDRSVMQWNFEVTENQSIMGKYIQDRQPQRWDYVFFKFATIELFGERKGRRKSTIFDGQTEGNTPTVTKKKDNINKRCNSIVKGSGEQPILYCREWSPSYPTPGSIFFINPVKPTTTLSHPPPPSK